MIAHLDRHSLRGGPILPVYSMVDRRRSLHRAALEAEPKWPVIPMASAFEAMSAAEGGAGRLPPSSPAAQAVHALWTGIERRLTRKPR